MEDNRELVKNKAHRVQAFGNTIEEAKDLARAGATDGEIRQRLRERRFEIADRAPDKVKYGKSAEAAHKFRKHGLK